MQATIIFRVFWTFFGLVILVNAKTCIPPNKKPFYWSQCAVPILHPYHAVTLEASQDGKPVLANGGMNLKKPCYVKSTFINEYNKPELSHHFFNYNIYHFTDDDTPGKCNWSLLETAGLTENVDACTVIEDNCKYKGHPTSSISTLDFVKTAGQDIIDAIQVGGYYCVEVVEYDGKTLLGCTRVCAKVIGK